MRALNVLVRRLASRTSESHSMYGRAGLVVRQYNSPERCKASASSFHQSHLHFKMGLLGGNTLHTGSVLMAATIAPEPRQHQSVQVSDKGSHAAVHCRL